MYFDSIKLFNLHQYNSVLTSWWNSLPFSGFYWYQILMVLLLRTMTLAAYYQNMFPAMVDLWRMKKYLIDCKEKIKTVHSVLKRFPELIAWRKLICKKNKKLESNPHINVYIDAWSVTCRLLLKKVNQSHRVLEETDFSSNCHICMRPKYPGLVEYFQQEVKR